MRIQNKNFLREFPESIFDLSSRYFHNDLRAYRGEEAPAPPVAPKQQIKTYDNGFGDTATQDKFNPSGYNQQQMSWAQEASKGLQGQLMDFNGADSQARAYADNLKAQGLKSFKRDSADLFGGYQADSAHRFGTLNNSGYDSQMKRFTQGQQEGLQGLENDYDTNYQNALTNRQSYLTNQLAIPQNVIANQYNNANGLSQNALQSSNAGNQFNQGIYGTQANIFNTQSALYAQQQELKEKARQANMDAAMRVAAAYFTQGKSEQKDKEGE